MTERQKEKQRKESERQRRLTEWVMDQGRQGKRVCNQEDKAIYEDVTMLLSLALRRWKNPYFDREFMGRLYLLYEEAITERNRMVLFSEFPEQEDYQVPPDNIILLKQPKKA